MFHLKSPFRCRDIQFFVFRSFSLFLPVGHCLRRWLQINLKVHNVVNCLNKNSITHFVWYLGKEKRYDHETLSIDRVSYKQHFNGKIMQKVQQKLVPDLFIILVNNLKQPLHARNCFKSKIFWKRIIKKPLERYLYFFFQTQSLSIDKIIKNKRGLELVTSRYSGYETSSEKFLY